MKKLLLLIASVVTALAMTSCMDDDEPQKTHAMAYFTVENTGATPILHMDGGGTVIPSQQSVTSIGGVNKFKDLERAMFHFTYTKEQVSADGKTVTGADIVQGKSLEVLKMMDKEKAESENITAADSLHNIKSLTHVWAYRGYLNVLFIGQVMGDEKNYFYPRMNMVYDPIENDNELNLHFYFNKRSKKTDRNLGEYEFCESFRLNEMNSLIPGTDSVKIAITFDGITKPFEMKVSRKDFTREF